MISFESKGDFQKTDKFLEFLSSGHIYRQIEPLAQAGVEALRSGTPIDTSESANSWDYEIKVTKNGVTIKWTNSHMADGVPVVILLQHGHGTGTGGYVQGRDFINPAMRPIFDKIADKVWKAVTSA